MNPDLKDLVTLHNKIDVNDWVVDVGGYRGDYAQAVIDRFDCWVMVFEPNLEMAAQIKERFKSNLCVKVEPVALAEEEGLERLFIREDGSSLFEEWAGTKEWKGVSVHKLSDYLREFNDDLPKIVKLNCEGSEYGIIKDLENNDLLSQIDEILVQFHKVPNWVILRRQAEKILSQTHEKVYDYKWCLYKKRTATPQAIGIMSGLNTAPRLMPQMS